MVKTSPVEGEVGPMPIFLIEDKDMYYAQTSFTQAPMLTAIEQYYNEHRLLEQSGQYLLCLFLFLNKFYAPSLSMFLLVSCQQSSGPL